MISPVHNSFAAAEREASGEPETRRLSRAAGVVALATVLSRVLGFVRDAMIASYFGAGFGSDAFLAAFRIPNLFRRLVSEGALNSAFVPVFTETLYRGGHAEADRLFGAASRVFAAALLILCAVGVLTAHWVVPLMTPGFPGPKLALTITLARLMFPYLFAAGMVALCMGALNVYGSFAPPALAPTLLNLGMIGTLAAVAPLMDRPVIGLAVGVLIGGATQLLFQVPFLLRYRLHLWRSSRFVPSELARMARLMVPAVLGGAVYQINILAGTLLASMLAEGSVSYLYYADRLAEFPLGVVAMAGATAALPSMSREAAAGDARAMAETFAYAFRLVSFVTIPAMTGLILLGEPILTVLFMRGEFGAADVRLTAQALSYYAVGLWAFATVRIAVAAFFALQDSNTPLRAAIWSILVNILLGLTFMKPMAHSGVALATSLASILNLAILLAFLRRRIAGVDWRSIGASLVRSILSAGIMAAGVVGIMHAMLSSGRQTPTVLAEGLCASIAGGALIYFAASRALGSREFDELLAHAARRVRSR
ncbi:MAG: murein biosynthesis integral membrane protein MurJ [Hyphomicrobiales bacterium]